MKNLWSDIESDKFQDDLELRVYISRILGQDTSLVLYGEERIREIYGNLVPSVIVRLVLKVQLLLLQKLAIKI